MSIDEFGFDEPEPTHPCPADGCQQQVPYAMLACAPHWRLVSPETRTELYSAWRYGPTSRHATARAKAVDEINARLGEQARRAAAKPAKLW